MSSIRRIFEARRLPLWTALAACALASPGLVVGFQVDDHFLRMALSDPPVIPEWSRTPFDSFALFAGEQGFVHAAADGGAVPWWAREDLRLPFFRPVTGLTHWFDFKVWPTRPWPMHLRSLLWFGAARQETTSDRLQPGVAFCIEPASPVPGRGATSERRRAASDSARSVDRRSVGPVRVLNAAVRGATIPPVGRDPHTRHQDRVVRG